MFLKRYLEQNERNVRSIFFYSALLQWQNYKFIYKPCKVNELVKKMHSLLLHRNEHRFFFFSLCSKKKRISIFGHDILFYCKNRKRTMTIDWSILSRKQNRIELNVILFCCCDSDKMNCWKLGALSGVGHKICWLHLLQKGKIHPQGTTFWTDNCRLEYKPDQYLLFQPSVNWKCIYNLNQV